MAKGLRVQRNGKRKRLTSIPAEGRVPGKARAKKFTKKGKKGDAR